MKFPMKSYWNTMNIPLNPFQIPLCIYIYPFISIGSSMKIPFQPFQWQPADREWGGTAGLLDAAFPKAAVQNGAVPWSMLVPTGAHRSGFSPLFLPIETTKGERWNAAGAESSSKGSPVFCFFGWLVDGSTGFYRASQFTFAFPIMT